MGHVQPRLRMDMMHALAGQRTILYVGAKPTTICYLRHAACKASGSAVESNVAVAQAAKGAAAISCCASHELRVHGQPWLCGAAEVVAEKAGRDDPPEHPRGLRREPRAARTVPDVTIGLKPAFAADRT